MKGYLTVKEAAEKFGYSVRWISKICKDNRIPGIERAGNAYLIPEDAMMPADSRITTGEYREWHKRFGRDKIPGYVMDPTKPSERKKPGPKPKGVMLKDA